MFINFDSLKKGEELRGGVLLPIRITATLAKLFVLKKIYGTYKPFRYENNSAKIREKGWFVRKGMGGISGEPLIRFNFVVPFVGTRYSSFHAYTRKGKPRVSLTWYVAFKGRLFQKIIKKLAA
tara:strand:- start:762 stop:1130 length:369 start_codon:yes stop_codon:yes gene_type:complete